MRTTIYCVSLAALSLLSLGCQATLGQSASPSPLLQNIASAIGLTKPETLKTLEKAGFARSATGFLAYKSSEPAKNFSVRLMGAGGTITGLSLWPAYRNKDFSLSAVLGIDATTARKIDNADAYFAQYKRAWLISQDGSNGPITVVPAPADLGLSEAPSKVESGVSTALFESVLTGNLDTFRAHFGAIGSVNLTRPGEPGFVATRTIAPFQSAEWIVRKDGKRSLLLEAPYGRGPKDYKALFGGKARFGQPVRDTKDRTYVYISVESDKFTGRISTNKGLVQYITLASRGK